MFAALYIPDFSLQAVLRLEPDLRSQPAALIDPELPQTEIIQCNPAAKNSDVVEGLTPAQAMARCPSLNIKTRSRSLENSATEILLQTAFAFSPNIESTATGVCALELKGLPLQNESEILAWAGKILQSLASLYLDAKIGVAPTPELALLAAQNTKQASIVRAANELARLPIAALQPSPEILAILSRWGICTLGQFLALGKNQVAERLGPDALELFGKISEDSLRPLRLVSPPVHFSERIEFEHQVETMEPLLFVLRRFVEQLSLRLKMFYRVVGEFQLLLGLSSGEKHERHFKIPSPTGNVQTLFRLLQTHLENVRADSPIESLQLAATPARPETHQFSLFENTLRDPNQFAETLARLAALVGHENVGSPVPEKTHKPDSFRMRLPNFDVVRHMDLKTAIQNAGPQLRRLRPPVSAHFEFRQEKPALIRSESFTGAVAAARGPFFGSGNWWDDARWAREEWDIETVDGLLLRIFTSNQGGFIEGIYD